jgi:hypothetical protein
MPSNRSLLDGYGLTPRPHGLPQIEYPFARNGDGTTRVITRTFRQPFAAFTPRVAERTAGAPDTDAEDALAYLVEESIPQPSPSRSLCEFTRTYARIPGPQIDYSSRLYSLPPIPRPNTEDAQWDYSAYLVHQPDPLLAALRVYDRKTVQSATALPTNPTGGTYTLSFGGDTTGSLAYNASAATIQTALNALASITAQSGVTVTGTLAAGFVVTFGSLATGSSAIGSLTVSTGSAISAGVTPSNLGRVQAISITAARNVAIAATSSSTMVTFLGFSGGFSVSSTNDTARWTYNNANDPVSGAFTLTVYGETTASIAYNATEATISAALNALTAISTRGGCIVTGTAGPGKSIDMTVLYPGITGGTYTLTLLGQTTGSIAYNASAATVEAALNALANVTALGGVTLTGAGYALPDATPAKVNAHQIAFTANFLVPVAITGDATSLTPSPNAITATPGTAQTLTITSAITDRFLAVTAHGLTAGEPIYVRTATGYAYDLTDYVITGADQIRVNGTLPPWNAASFVTLGRYLRTYTPGPVRLRTRRTQRYYLPGVTPGIATPEDIPIPASSLTDEAFLAALFAGATYVDYSAEELAPWLGSIYLTTQEELNITDV